VKGVTLLGATGSVGSSTLDVLRTGSERYRLEAVAAGTRAGELARIVLEFRPRLAALATADAATDELRTACKTSGTQLLLGPEASCEAAASAGGDIVVAAIVGAAGLPATAAAIERGATVALANKESLVVAGAALTTLAARSGATLLPVDSEHAALHQCLRGGRREEVRRLILTASGGPFRTRPAGTFASITVADALAHPTWKMGAKITIDSATLMNKGLELIEARWLFGFTSDKLDAIIHPQSIVHSLVEFRDGSVLAQLSKPDMRDPVRYCLDWPHRLEAPVAPLDLAAVSPLTFERPDDERFPALRLARAALMAGGAAPAVLNAANEVGVAAFLEDRIGFTSIAALIEDTMPASVGLGAGTLAEALEADRVGRSVALDALSKRTR
jgi:1-deoxy-D-xylulose-5-phosphate reductoisomerase